MLSKYVGDTHFRHVVDGGICKNLIVPEEELLEALTAAVGAEWNGAENVDEEVFENLKTVKIYEDGRIEIELNAEKKPA